MYIVFKLKHGLICVVPWIIWEMNVIFMFTQNWAHISQPEFDPEPKWKREKEKELKMIEIAE